MTDYHIRCDILEPGIYAGTLKPDGPEWKTKSDCTTEALCAAAKYLLFSGKKFQFRHRDQQYALTIEESAPDGFRCWGEEKRKAE